MTREQLIKLARECVGGNNRPIGQGLADIKARGIDAHLEDLEAEMAPKKKRKKTASPAARTLAECRRRGWIAGVVERRIPFPKPRGTTIDLFGVIDIVAVDPTAPIGQRIIGIQATTNGSGDRNGGRHAEHRDKIFAEPRARQWVEAGGRLELWSWAKQGARGKAKRWTLRVETWDEMCDAANEEMAF